MLQPQTSKQLGRCPSQHRADADIILVPSPRTLLSVVTSHLELITSSCAKYIYLLVSLVSLVSLALKLYLHRVKMYLKFVNGEEERRGKKRKTSKISQ